MRHNPRGQGIGSGRKQAVYMDSGFDSHSVGLGIGSVGFGIGSAGVGVEFAGFGTASAGIDIGLVGVDTEPVDRDIWRSPLSFDTE